MEEAEKLFDRDFPVLGKVSVRLVGYLGSDSKIVQSRPPMCPTAAKRRPTGRDGNSSIEVFRFGIIPFAGAISFLRSPFTKGGAENEAGS